MHASCEGEKTVNELKPTLAQLDTLLTWGPNWNSYDALAPNPQAVAHAKEWIAKLYQCVQEWQLEWLEPHVVPDGDGWVVFEWWHKFDQFKIEHKLVVYVSPNHQIDFLQVISTDDHGDMSYSDLSLSKASDCESVWKWLVGNKEEEK